MKKLVKVETLKDGDRFEFVTSRSEWADNCYLPHPKGVIVVAKSAFRDTYDQCRFGWRMEKFPNSRPQDWWGKAQTEVRLLGPAPAAAPTVEAVKKPAAKKKKLAK